MSIEVSDDRAGIGVADQGLVFDPSFTTRLDLGDRGWGCPWRRVSSQIMLAPSTS